MRIALGQHESVRGDVEANLARMERTITGSRADLVVFPELFLTGYGARDEHKRLAEDLEGPSVGRVKDMAKASGATVVFGMPERDTVKSGMVYNTAVLVLPDGQVFSYRKWSPANFGPFEEKIFFAEGQQLPVFDTPVGRIGMFICYDTFFPEIHKALALQGAELLVGISAGPFTSKAFFEAVLPARAIENGSVVVFCNLVGTQLQFPFYGGSQIIGPRGELVAKGPYFQDAIIVGEVNLKDVELTRLYRPTLKDSRKEAFDFIEDLFEE
jgi:predicted amidohydrolase